MGLRVHSRAKDKLHDLEKSSLIHYKKFKIKPSAKKTMVTVFRYCEGLLQCKFLKPKTMNSDK
jgi:hypothetical protein